MSICKRKEKEKGRHKMKIKSYCHDTIPLPSTKSPRLCLVFCWENVILVLLREAAEAYSFFCESGAANVVSNKAVTTYTVACPAFFMVLAQWGRNPILQCLFFKHLLATSGASCKPVHSAATAATLGVALLRAVLHFVTDGPAPKTVLPSCLDSLTCFDPGDRYLGVILGGLGPGLLQLVLQLLLARVNTGEFVRNFLYFYGHPCFYGRHPRG